MCDVNYKALWVEDENLDELLTEADVHGVTLCQETNLEDALINLKANFEDYSAVVLDANCLLDRKSTITDNAFLVRSYFAVKTEADKRHTDLPIYVLSEGTMSLFPEMLNAIYTPDRKKYDSDWGVLFYNKHSSDERLSLWSNIVSVGEHQTYNKVRYRHSKLFDLLGEGNLIPNRDAKKIMLRLLSLLYYPEEIVEFDLETNPVRKVIECLFYSIKDKGLLPNECFEPKYNNLDCWRFITGQEVRRETDKEKTTIRFGEKGESILPKDHHEELKDLSQLLINYEAIGCHVVNGKLVVEEDERELFYGYVMMLTHLIKEVGKYVETHQSKEENEKKINRKTEQKEEYEVTDEIKQQFINKAFLPEKDEKGNWHCGECLINPNYDSWREGLKIKVIDVDLNLRKTEKNKQYPYFAKFKTIRQ